MKGSGLLCLGLLLGSPVQAARWSVDAAHSNVLFFVSHYELARSVGRFGQIDGAFEIDPDDPTRNRAEVVIQTASLDMGEAGFTRTLLGPDWFDAQAHPEIRFTSERVSAQAAGGWLVEGQLQIGETRQPVQLQLTRYRCATPPFSGRYSCGYSLSGHLDRRDFGLDRLPRWVGHAVELRIEIELQREKPRGPAQRKR